MGNLQSDRMNLYAVCLLFLALLPLLQFPIFSVEQTTPFTNNSSYIEVNGHKYLFVEDRFSEEIKNLTVLIVWLTLPLLIFAILTLLITFYLSAKEKLSHKKDTLYTILQEVINNASLVLHNKNLAVKKVNIEEPEVFRPKYYKTMINNQNSTVNNNIWYGNFYFETNSFKSIQNSGYLTTLNSLTQRNINDLYDHIIDRNEYVSLLEKYEKQLVFVNPNSQSEKLFEEERIKYFKIIKSFEDRIKKTLILKTLHSLSEEIKNTSVWKILKIKKSEIDENDRFIKDLVGKLDDKIYEKEIDGILATLNSYKSKTQE